MQEKFFRPLNFVNMLLDFSPQRDIQDDPRRSNETGRVNYGGSFSLKTLLESKKALLFSSQTKRRETIFHGASRKQSSLQVNSSYKKIMKAV